MDALPLVLASILRSVTNSLRIIAPKQSRRLIVEPDEEGCPIRSSGVFDVVFFLLFANQSLTCSQIPYPELGKCLPPPKQYMSSSVVSIRYPKRPHVDHPGGCRPSIAMIVSEVRTEEE